MTSVPTLSSPLLALPGAVPGSGPDAGVALHYGDPSREQRSLARTAGWVDRSTRGVIAVPGADRLSWLHSITSQHLSALPDGRGTEGLVLSPHGHVEHHFAVAETGGTTWLDTEPGGTGGLLAYLTSMRFMLRVEPRDATAELAVLTVLGPDAPAVLARAGLPVPAGPWAVLPLPAGTAPGTAGTADVGSADVGSADVGSAGVGSASVGSAGAGSGAVGFVRRMPWADSDALDLLVPRAELAAYAARLTDAGAAPAGSWAYEALRVEHRHPRAGFETDHRTIPHEVGWIGSAVHLDKGCYRGQETVARVQNLGKPPRRLVLLHLSGERDQLPPPGTPLQLDGRTVGFLGTAVQHHELGPVALAVLKRTLPDTTLLTVDAATAAIDPD